MRLAVIGLASSHVDQIVRLAARGRLGPARVEALVAAEQEPVPPERAGALHRAAGLDPAQAPHPVERCDAALVTTRDPATHRALTEPLLRAGVPVFVDKPFVTDPADAEALVALAERRGVALSSSSALRWHPTVRAAARRWADHDPGLTVRVSGPGDAGSPYGGRAFLGAHAVEAALGSLALRDDRGGPSRLVRVDDDGDRRTVELSRGADRMLIELGAADGWRIEGPGVAAALPLDEEYLRPGLLGFVEAVARGDGRGPIPGARLIEAARVLAEVCR